MSLLFDHALDRFEPHVEDLYTVQRSDLASVDGDPIPIRPILEFAKKQDLAFSGEEDYLCIPLHGEASAEPTGEFVAYADSAIRGEIIVYRDGSGDRGAIDVDKFAQTQLAQRIRFWHSDYQPPEYPPGYDRPVDDQEPPERTLEPQEFVTDLRELVEAERQATREANRERAETQTPEDIYRGRGGAIPRIVYQDHDGDALRFVADPEEDPEKAAYYLPREYGIYQGNEILIVTDGDESFLLPGQITDIRGLQFEVRPDWSAVDSPSAVRSRLMNDRVFGCVQLLNPTPTDRELSAIDDLADDPILSVLTGQRPVTFSHGAGGDETFDKELNQEQRLAVDLAMLADDMFCIHGPPGTGKTRTLIEIIRRAVAAGERILVCADSNQAVNNILIGDSTAEEVDTSSLHAHGQYHTEEMRIVRTNAERQPNPLIQQYNDDTANADVVLSTNNRAATLPPTFDLVVHDEATQASVPSSCIPLTKGKRVILAGDHKQLPPFQATESPPETALGFSLFEHLYADGGIYEGVGVQLKTQYRMHQNIARFSDREFYDRELRQGRHIDPLPSQKHAIEGYNIGGDVTVDDHSRRNPAEAKLVTYLVDELRKDVEPGEIGVITPYAAQVREIKNRLAATFPATVAGAVMVDTIDSFQGGEREAIILSLVRSNADGDIGFLGRESDGPRRLNVALSRAKRYCAVVADFYTLRYTHEQKPTDLYQRFNDLFCDTGRRRDVDPDFIPTPSTAD